MSGSGGDTPPSWGEGGAADDCDFTLETTLRAPDPVGVGTVAVGERLAVHVDLEKPAVEVMKGTQRVGSIVERVPRFVGCDRKGVAFVAEVVAVDGGSVTVRTHKS
jgi:hypothetical protein